MASGNYQSNTGVNCNIRIEWTSASSIETNTSSVNVKVYLIHSALYNGAKSMNIVCMGETKTVQVRNYNYGQNIIVKDLIGEATFNVAHNSDGSKSGTISATIPQFNVIYSGKQITSLGCSGTAVLDTIPRASTPSLSSSTFDFGQAVTISISRASTSFTHNLSYMLGGATYAIAQGVATSTSWAIPTDLVNLIPNSTSIQGTLICATYNGTTKIGEKTLAFTATVPSSAVPRISSITLTDPNGFASTYGGYVQNKSRLKVDVTSEGIYGSTISQIAITANDVTSNTNPYESNVITASEGTKTVSVTVTDSRGRTATGTSSYTVLAYTSPTITALKGERCKSDGTLDEEGGYIKATMVASITSLNSKNTKLFVLEYKTGSGSWTSVASYDSSYALNTTMIFSADIDSSYEVRLTATDAFSATSYSVTAGTAFTLMDFHSSGKGIAVGKVSEIENLFDINLPTKFHNTVEFSGGIVRGTVEFITGRTDKIYPSQQDIVITGTGSQDYGSIPGIGFHIPNVCYSTLKYYPDDSFRFVNATSTGYVPVHASTFYENGVALSDKYLSTYVADATDNVTCLQNAFGAVPKSKATAVRLQHGSHSMALGWFLEGYDYSHAYGGWFVSDYGTPSWVGVNNGAWHTAQFITSNNIGSQYVHHANYAGVVHNGDGNYMNFSWWAPGGQPTFVWGSNDRGNVYVYNPSDFEVYTSAKVRQHATRPIYAHPGSGVSAFYSWNTGQAYNDSEGYSNGITIGSNPSDPNYGFQIVQNMWDDRLYTRRFSYGWQDWKTVAFTSDFLVGGSADRGYVRFPTLGIQIAWVRIAFTTAINYKWGNLYLSGTSGTPQNLGLGAWPAAFSAEPAVTYNVTGGNGTTGVLSESASNFSATQAGVIILFRGSGLADSDRRTYTVHAIAIGTYTS